MAEATKPEAAHEGALPPIAELLADLPLFAKMDAVEREGLAQSLESCERPAGATLFHVGDPGERMFVICQGAVELSTTDKLGQKIVFATLGAGEMFGELSLLDMGPRSATARVTEPARLLTLGRAGLEQFLQRHPTASLDLLSVMAARLRATDERLRQSSTRNVNEAFARKSSWIERATDAIAAFSGSFAFLMLHAAVFGIWIGWNVASPTGFDPFPFGLLTMCVSLEAIFLSVIVLLSQNRESAKERVRADIEYEVNVRAELEISHLHDKIDGLQAALLARLEGLEKGNR